jgi:3D (Asp-Asp-Asp) domain-containing protein
VDRAPPHLAPPTNPTQTFSATAYRQGSITASGTRVGDGIVAADPAVLPLGTTIRVSGFEHRYNRVHRVLDTGRSVRGREIDVYMATAGRRSGSDGVTGGGVGGSNAVGTSEDLAQFSVNARCSSDGIRRAHLRRRGPNGGTRGGTAHASRPRAPGPPEGAIADASARPCLGRTTRPQSSHAAPQQLKDSAQQR